MFFLINFFYLERDLIVNFENRKHNMPSQNGARLFHAKGTKIHHENERRKPSLNDSYLQLKITKPVLKSYVELNFYGSKS